MAIMGLRVLLIVSLFLNPLGQAFGTRGPQRLPLLPTVLATQALGFATDFSHPRLSAGVRRQWSLLSPRGNYPGVHEIGFALLLSPPDIFGERMLQRMEQDVPLALAVAILSGIALFIPSIRNRMPDVAHSVARYGFFTGLVFSMATVLCSLTVSLLAHPSALLAVVLVALALIIPALHDLVYARRGRLEVDESVVGGESPWLAGLAFYRWVGSPLNLFAYFALARVLSGAAFDAAFIAIGLVFIAIHQMIGLALLHLITQVIESRGNITHLLPEASITLKDVNEKISVKATGVGLLLPEGIQGFVDEPYVLRWIGIILPAAVVIKRTKYWRPLSNVFAEWWHSRRLVFSHASDFNTSAFSAAA